MFIKAHKFLAALLLGLFVFIITPKSYFHTCESLLSLHHEQSTNALGDAHDCTLCKIDHITYYKTEAVFFTEILGFVKQKTTFFKTHNTSTCTRVIVGRGPPTYFFA